MAVPGGKGPVGSHLEENTSEKQGFLSRVKDSLNFTKHLGFVSDLDSPASQLAIAQMREKREREGVAEVVEQAPLSERIMEGVAGLAQTCTEITTGVGGGVGPIGAGSPEEPESFKESALQGETSDEKQELSDGPVRKELEHQQDRSNGPVPKELEHQQDRSDGPVPKELEHQQDRSDGPVPKELEHQQDRSNGPTPKELEHQQDRSNGPTPKELEHQQDRSNGPVPKELEHQQDHSNGPVAQDKEQRKHSKPWAHWPGHKETDAKAEKESRGFSQWALRAARKLGDAVASKDLTDDPSYKR